MASLPYYLQDDIERVCVQKIEVQVLVGSGVVVQCSIHTVLVQLEIV